MPSAPRPDRIVVKIGTSSLVSDGRVDPDKAAALVASVAELVRIGYRPVLVASGAIALGNAAGTESRSLAAAIGQGPLYDALRTRLAHYGLTAAQFLLTPIDLVDPRHRPGVAATLDHALDSGVIPVVNENDAVRVRNNDILAALISALLHARLLVLLTDVPGLYDGDPRVDPGARLIPEIKGMSVEVERLAGVTDRAGVPGSADGVQAGGLASVQAGDLAGILAGDLAGGSGTVGLGTGGMVTKLGAVWIATTAGVSAAIVGAREPNALTRLLRGEPVGTVVHPRAALADHDLEQLWRAFADPPTGTLTCRPDTRQLIAAVASIPCDAVVRTEGRFAEGDVVDLAVPGGEVLARGRTRHRHSSLGPGAGGETVVHPSEYVSFLEAS
ncbi:PUA domain-containing protein [Catenulispora yoronensis]